MQIFARALVLVIAIIGTWRVSASDTIQYTSWWDKEESRLYRHNNTTGELERLERSGNSFSWSAVIVQASPKQKTPSRPAPPVVPATKPKDIATSEPEKPKIQLFADDGKEITDEITDIDRQRSQPAIAAYTEKLSVLCPLTQNDRITGTLLVRNNGERRIRAMEVTLTIAIEGRDKPVEHRFFFSEKEAKNRPPEPTINGEAGMSLLYRIDVPTPSGKIQNKNVAITYIKLGE